MPTTRDSFSSTLTLRAEDTEISIPRSFTFEQVISSIKENFEEFRSIPIILQTDEMETFEGVRVEIGRDIWDLVVSSAVSLIHVIECPRAAAHQTFQFEISEGGSPPFSIPRSDASQLTCDSAMALVKRNHQHLQPYSMELQGYVDINPDTWCFLAEHVSTIDVRLRGQVLPFVGFHIIIQSLARKTIPIAFDRQATVAALKTKLCNIEGVPPDLQRFIFAGKQLEDDFTLEDYNMQSGSIIHFVLRLRGGKPVIYLFSPHEQEARVRLSLVPQWDFSAVYPIVPIERDSSVSKGQSAEWVVRIREDGTLSEVSTGLDVAYLFWEAHTNPEFPVSPLPSPRMDRTTENFVPSQPVIDNMNSVVLPIGMVPLYLSQALQALGLHTEARTSFITYWLPSLLKHAYIALRFLPQTAYERSAPLDVCLSPDVTTRIFMLFKGITAECVAREWNEAVKRADVDVTMWREIVGIDIVKVLDKKLFRVLEWGGMEVV
ncbi:ubiquitin family protein [Moniliophthora roreri MCA 2997]|uniref:Ubiquitin family protein n=2 Tax=Moniliophthora roreri TaxID=221103 RepID=V2YHS7_MONRO|nr:ubiquitin family protein [Moniliophthora roreri MCA 2997]